jgi:hypothetical protein
LLWYKALCSRAHYSYPLLIHDKAKAVYAKDCVHCLGYLLAFFYLAWPVILSKTIHPISFLALSKPKGQAIALGQILSALPSLFQSSPEFRQSFKRAFQSWLVLCRRALEAEFPAMKPGGQRFLPFHCGYPNLVPVNQHGLVVGYGAEIAGA